MHIIHCSTPHCIPSYFPTVTELRSSIMPRLVLRDCCSHVCSPDHKWWRTFPSPNFLPFAIPTLSYATLSVPHVEVMWETTAREIRSLSTGWSVKEPICAQAPTLILSLLQILLLILTVILRCSFTATVGVKY